jgi:hypothetical protein
LLYIILINYGNSIIISDGYNINDSQDTK